MITKKKNKLNFIISRIPWIVSGFILGGVVGNSSYDLAKVGGKYVYTQLFLRAELDAQHEGYSALMDADTANNNKNVDVAKAKYEYAIERLNFAAKGGMPRAMVFLYELYCTGRDGYVEQNIALGRYWGAAALSNGDMHGSNDCPK